jgi:hypothetical protein
MFLGCLIALLVVIAVAVVAMSAAHIPGLRDLTGAAPLQKETPTCAGCIGCGGPDCIERPENAGEAP